MNGRIQELSKQAYELQRHKHGGYFTQQLLLDAFAELIIKECASIAGKAEYSDTWTESVEDTIKKHFGVEE